jgi:hypothetical protein
MVGKSGECNRVYEVKSLRPNDPRPVQLTLELRQRVRISIDHPKVLYSAPTCFNRDKAPDSSCRADYYNRVHLAPWVDGIAVTCTSERYNSFGPPRDRTA